MTLRIYVSTCLCAQESMYRFRKSVTGCISHLTVLVVVLMYAVSIMHVSCVHLITYMSSGY